MALAQECPDTLWTQVIDYPAGVAAVEAYDQILLEDEGLLLCGYYGYAPTAQVWVARTNSAGDTLWTRTYGDPALNETCLSMCRSGDGTFVLAGLRGWGYAQPDDSSVVFALKIDIEGDTIWTRTFGKVGSLIGWAIVSAEQGGYAIAGATNYWRDFFHERSPEADSSNMFLLRLNENGDSLWYHEYGGALGDEAFSLTGQQDGGFTLSGASASFGDIWGDVYVVRTDAAGQALWSTTYGHAGRGDFAFAMDTRSDGSFLLVGESYYTEPGSEAYLLCIDTSGP